MIPMGHFFFILLLLISVYAQAEDSISLLKEYCEKSQSDYWAKNSEACKLARGELELTKLCFQFVTSNSPQAKNKIQSIFDKVAELKSVDSDVAAAELCPEQLGSKAILSKPECGHHEASGKIQRNWWDGKEQTKVVRTFNEVKVSADSGDEVAQFNLGAWLTSGAPCVPKDMKLGVQYLCRSYDKGFNFAGLRLKSLAGSPPSEQRAREILGKQYGCALTDRQKEYLAETKKFEEQAKANLKKAAAGDVRAMIKVGKTYLSDDYGLKQDYKEAVKWFQKAANKGSAEAMGALAGMYSRGDGIEKDNEEAFKWSLKAAQKGDVDSMYFVGLNYYDGQGVETDLQKSVQWLVKAMDLGHTEAMDKLAEMYLRGELQAVAFKSISERLKKLESKK